MYVDVCVCICIYVCMCINIYVYVYTYEHTHMHVYMYGSTHKHTYIHVHSIYHIHVQMHTAWERGKFASQDTLQENGARGTLVQDNRLAGWIHTFKLATMLVYEHTYMLVRAHRLYNMRPCATTLFHSKGRNSAHQSKKPGSECTAKFRSCCQACPPELPSDIRIRTLEQVSMRTSACARAREWMYRRRGQWKHMRTHAPVHLRL